MAPPRPWDIDQQRGAAYRRGASTSSTSRIGRPNSRITYYDKPRPAPAASNAGWANSAAELSRQHGVQAPTFSSSDAVTEWWRSGSSQQAPAYPQMPQMPTSGGGGRGGGGGGGGGGGLTAQQQQAMARLLDPRLMSFTPFNAPAYQAFTPTPRDTAMYDTARRRIGAGRDADISAANSNYTQLLQLLAGQQNVMANPQMTQTPAMQQAYQRIVGGAPGNRMVADVINSENAYSQNSDNAFANLMAVLASQEGRNMQSRQREAMQDRTNIMNNIRAQAAGMLGGVEMADLQDAKEYARYLNDIGLSEHRYGADRDYSTAYANWQGQQGVDQSNVGIQNEWAQAIMGLIPMLTDAGVLAQIGA